MTFYLTYQIKGFDGQFVMPISPDDNVQYVTSRVKSEFAIIPNLKAKIYGSYLQSTSILSQCIRNQDIITFEANDQKDDKTPNLYRKPIITPRYKSEKTFIVFSTVNFKSMTEGDKINVDGADTDKELKKKIEDKLTKNYKGYVNAKLMNVIIFLPGGIPLTPNVPISKFMDSFPDFMPHLYAIVVNNKEILSKLDKQIDNVCNIKDEDLKLLLSPCFDSELDGLCEIASVLGYINNSTYNTERMIYSIAKFCPFAPMICALYKLSTRARPTGRDVLQITAPLSTLFIEIGNSLNDQSNLFKYTAKFLTYFMNITVSERIPCTEFMRPFYNIGLEKYFYENYTNGENNKIESVVAFDPDIRDQDWIKFELPKFKEEDFEQAMENTKALNIIPTMSLREIHRVSLFNGANGPWLFITASNSKEEKDKDKIDYINPEVGQIQTDTYEHVAVLALGSNLTEKEFNDKITDSIDPEKVKQLVVICVDKSGSMDSDFDQGLNRFQASQKFFIKFTNACYRFHTTSMYGSIMFNSKIEVRNALNPLVTDFERKMIKPGEGPYGGTALFAAINSAAQLLTEENKGNKYPNAILRIIVISDGEDIYLYNQPQKIANIANNLLSNHIRVDSIIVSDEIAAQLVALTHFTGGVVMFPGNFANGINLFNKEEFFNVDIREFGQLHQPNLSANNFNNLPKYTINDLDKKIGTITNQYISKDKVVTSPNYAISEFNKLVKAQEEGSQGITIHPQQKRIIRELKKIISEPDDNIKVYPFKDQIDVWRVLIKGSNLSFYPNKWFYMIIEFPGDYPAHYPLFRFVKPPFHPNITDGGRVCIDTLDQTYRSDKSVKSLIEQVRNLFVQPNFESAVDQQRENMNAEDPQFHQLVDEWNEKNAKDSYEDWIKDWKIEKDGKLYLQNVNLSIVPEKYICPITRRIMKEPVKATSGAYYEKRALEGHVKTADNPTCRANVDDKGKPIPLPVAENLNLPVDNKLKTEINKWIKDNNYHEQDEDDVDTELLNISYFNKSGQKTNKPAYIIKHDGSAQVQDDAQDHESSDDDDFASIQQQSRPRPNLK